MTTRSDATWLSMIGPELFNRGLIALGVPVACSTGAVAA